MFCLFLNVEIDRQINRLSQDLVVNNNTFESIKEFIYLGSLINYKSKIEDS